MILLAFHFNPLIDRSTDRSVADMIRTAPHRPTCNQSIHIHHPLLLHNRATGAVPSKGRQPARSWPVGARSSLHPHINHHHAARDADPPPRRHRPGPAGGAGACSGSSGGRLCSGRAAGVHGAVGPAAGLGLCALHGRAGRDAGPSVVREKEGVGWGWCGTTSGGT